MGLVFSDYFDSIGQNGHFVFGLGQFNGVACMVFEGLFGRHNTGLIMRILAVIAVHHLKHRFSHLSNQGEIGLDFIASFCDLLCCKHN